MKKISGSRQDNPEEQKPRQYQPSDSSGGDHYIHGYTRCLRNTNLAVVDLFSDLTILNEDDNTLYPVPIVWGTQEKAAIVAFGEQFVANPDRRDTGLVDRIILPITSLQPGDISFDENRYIYHAARRKVAYSQEKRPFDTVYKMSKGIPVNCSYNLHIWTKYYEHMMQLVEQIMQKFSPISYIKIDGVPWESPVSVTGSASNITEDVGDRAERILRYVFNLNVESHIMQPIRRDKTTLKLTQKYVVLGDLMPNNVVSTVEDEVSSDDVPEDYE